MKMIILFVILITSLSCSSMPPPKNHVSKTYEMVPACLYMRISETEYKSVCPGEEGYPINPIVISLDDYSKDINYENLLIKSCQIWR